MRHEVSSPTRSAASFARAGAFGVGQITTDAGHGTPAAEVLEECLSRLDKQLQAEGMSGGLVRLVLRLSDIDDIQAAQAVVVARYGALTPPVLCVGAPPADGSALSVEALVLL